jgi:hypothetical protein
MDPRAKSDTIDVISIDDATGTVQLHAIVEGDWTNYDERMDNILRKMNLYLFFVRSGQLAADRRYQGRPVKFMINVEQHPPQLALIGFARMKDHLGREGIALGVTCGFDITEITLPGCK